MSTSTSGSGPIRVVLRPEVDAATIEDGALDLDWLLIGHWSASDRRPYEDQYVGLDESTTISYIDDDLVGLRYLVIRGPMAESTADAVPTGWVLSAPEALSTLQAAIEQGGPTERWLPAALLSASPDDRGAVLAAALAAAETDPDAQSMLVLAATYLDWPELRAAVADLAAGAADPGVRQEAAAALRGIDAVGRSRGGADGPADA